MKYKSLALIIIALSATSAANAQFLMDMVDTTTDIGKGMLGIYKKFDNIRISGYIQPQFQVAQTKGAKSFAGGNFNEHVTNRFMLRRGRIRFDYIYFAEEKGPSVQFVFQFDGTERGVVIRDFWGRIFENKYKVFALTAGMFARPFSYELNLSSSDRETPERGRMSQLLMRTERDLGAMVSYEPRERTHPLYLLKFDVGLFNGQGLPATADFDSYKDLITRLSLKPLLVADKHLISSGISYLNGGMIQNTKYINVTETVNDHKTFVLDSSAENYGQKAPRKYYGGDVQFKFKSAAGYTEVRAEYMKGTQTATQFSSETPHELLTGSEGYYIRKFDGAYFYLLHNIINAQHQAVVKFDWYDPNTAVAKDDIGKPNKNFTPADIKFYTLGFGYVNYINPNLKVVIWYDLIRNEKTQLPGFTTDVKDDIFTLRLQFRF